MKYIQRRENIGHGSAPFRFRYRRPWAGMAALAWMLVSTATAWAQDSRAESFQQLDISFVTLAEKVAPSVVQILVDGYGAAGVASEREAPQPHHGRDAGG
ncbi:MAG TPA: hypothetical protein VG206_26430 [Terriglobia bacterium]|nr:hypothetical protein [Terriglobia bacterium]